MTRFPWGVRVGVATLMVVAAMVATTSPLRAQRGLDEDEVKAAFLFNFVKFVQWPPSNDRPADVIVIGVVGREPFGDVMDSVVRGKTVNGRELVVRRLSADQDPRTVHMLFIEASEARRSADVLKRAQSGGVLTVGETRQFLEEGGLVRFYVEANRLRFQIDAEGAQREGLKISSQLLSLAKK